jgi:uncharacterized protein YebE (UPF0316 family)
MINTIFTSEFLNSEIYSYIVLPLLIFCARIIDVSIGTIRIIFVSKGNKAIAPILGFFEVLIWLLAISRIIVNLDNILCYIGFAAGFATGNYVGMIIEEKLAYGINIIRIITNQSATKLINALNMRGFGSTIIDAMGAKEKVNVIYSIVKRQDVPEVINLIETHNPKAFFSIEDVRFVKHGLFPVKETSVNINPFKRWRKGK